MDRGKGRESGMVFIHNDDFTARLCFSQEESGRILVLHAFFFEGFSSLVLFGFVEHNVRKFNCTCITCSSSVQTKLVKMDYVYFQSFYTSFNTI